METKIATVSKKTVAIRALYRKAVDEDRVAGVAASKARKVMLECRNEYRHAQLRDLGIVFGETRITLSRTIYGKPSVHGPFFVEGVDAYGQIKLQKIKKDGTASAAGSGVHWSASPEDMTILPTEGALI